jgi:hypothetical protein
MALFDSLFPVSQFPETQVLEESAQVAPSSKVPSGSALFERVADMVRGTLQARQRRGDWLDTMTLRR